MTRCYLVALGMILTSIAWCQDSAMDLKKLQGKWLPITAELAGQPFPAETLKVTSLVIAGEKYLVTVGKTVDQGVLKIDVTATPKAMDIVGSDGPNKDKTFHAIYEIKDDTMRICYDLSGKSRPAEFKTSKGGLFYLVTYQRAK